ncbi:hypothetical protein [Rubrobacter calidifluminis]|uniref:hypothetical protein n=1 Tax=Rubrobacter calidifluminis TaxID=1392640 RepID=UPI00235E9629|nr:hypothetical protein [Rubrobacter calidifluminis]
MRAVLLAEVRSLSGERFGAGEVVEVVLARDGVPEVCCGSYLPLNACEYQLLDEREEN